MPNVLISHYPVLIAVKPSDISHLYSFASRLILPINAQQTII